MALKKVIQARAGFPLEYWRIGDWRVKMTQNLMEITLVPYLSAQTRSDGLQPINEEIRKIKIFDRINKLNLERSVTSYTDIFSPQALKDAKVDIYTLMYNYIKENVEEFKDSEDV